MDLGYDEEQSSVFSNDDRVKIVEYWGRVPAKFLEDKEDSLGETFDYDEDELVEAVVVIANDSTVGLLRKAITLKRHLMRSYVPV